MWSVLHMNGDVTWSGWSTKSLKIPFFLFLKQKRFSTKWYISLSSEIALES